MEDAVFRSPIDGWLLPHSKYRPSYHPIVAWCPDCRRYHRHGLSPRELGTQRIHRSAHCYGSGGGNYLIRLQGPADKAIIADLGRRRPRGPAGCSR